MACCDHATMAHANGSHACEHVCCKGGGLRIRPTSLWPAGKAAPISRVRWLSALPTTVALVLPLLVAMLLEPAPATTPTGKCAGTDIVSRHLQCHEYTADTGGHDCCVRQPKGWLRLAQELAHWTQEGTAFYVLRCLSEGRGDVWGPRPPCSSRPAPSRSSTLITRSLMRLLACSSCCTCVHRNHGRMWN